MGVKTPFVSRIITVRIMFLWKLKVLSSGGFKVKSIIIIVYYAEAAVQYTQ